MTVGIEALSAGEVNEIRQVLVGLKSSLQNKSGLGKMGGALTDETIVLNALEHPERGDIEVIVLRDGNSLDIFLSNRREADSPFSVMNADKLRMYPGRRPVDSSQSVLKKGEYGLFLLSIQDRDLLRHKSDGLIRIFSTHFGISDSTPDAGRKLSDLRQKPLEACTNEEKWQILAANAPGDNRIATIQQEFFGLDVSFSRYKQPSKVERLMLNQTKYKETIGQLIRDIYPYGIRVSLRRDYPKEHKVLLEKVHQTIQSVESELRSRATRDYPAQVRSHLIRTAEYLKDILDNDPELTRVV